ncbi:high-affinity branched-chain amino acid ABC transporter substrate-binding protein [Comamonas flocculans]|uniref:High-affinity branched-chain amino acid ABC transporter substrate-binding protein n=1 Tax=Comamonas flocculans TaxID=2597701 RepID=A0A5B8RSS5_9BURK|nr:high-affinity branched-chain amino acid ABC transporter substrate-binding protein [Comamonas flocculans]QEA12163.1 high-affinity branched-chain amino acid ABC transporter substrate-binding protein [Comamonas flocculans]
MKLRTRICTALSALAATALTLTAHAQIRIGLMIPASGPLTQYATMVKDGVNTAVEGVNASGGINGQQVQTVVFDDACDPKKAPATANQLLDNKIRYVVGPVCSGAAIAAAPIYNSQHVVVVTPSATSPSLTDGTDYHYIFRTIGPDNEQGAVAAQFIVEKIKPRRVAILHDKQAYGRGIANTARKILGREGVEVVMYEGITAGQKDYASVVERLKAAAVDFVYFGGYHSEMGVLLRDARAQGLGARMMGPEGVANEEINTIGGDAVEGMLVTLPADFSAVARNAPIVKAFKDKKRDPSGAFQLTSYAAAQVIMDSIKAVGDDPRLVAEHMHKTTFQTPLGPTSWKPNGDLKSFEFQVFEWHKDGSKTLVK